MGEGRGGKIDLRAVEKLPEGKTGNKKLEEEKKNGPPKSGPRKIEASELQSLIGRKRGVIEKIGIST